MIKKDSLSSEHSGALNFEHKKANEECFSTATHQLYITSSPLSLLKQILCLFDTPRRFVLLCVKACTCTGPCVWASTGVKIHEKIFSLCLQS